MESQLCACVMEYQSTENHGLSVMESIMENIYVPKSLNFILTATWKRNV